ncbi:MAG: NUDIX hydrolase [Clostridia bacterium]|nr:NUDIX hydrolase [Clostridia bacterium]
MSFFDVINIKAQNDGVIKKIVGGIITNEKGEVLFLKRRVDDFFGGILELPSGNVEEKEKIDQALIREIKEETNLDVSNIGVFVNSFDYLSSSGKKSRQFNFSVKVESTENVFLTEHDEFTWLSYENIICNENITPEVKYSIEIYEYNKNN